MKYRIGKYKPPVETRFKKGISGNPEGGRKHCQVKKILKELTSKELEDAIKLVITSTEAEVRMLISSPETPTFKVILGRAMIQAANKGDYSLLNKIMSRVLDERK